MAAGDFTAAQLVQVTLRAEELFSEGGMYAKTDANAEAARVILANQTADFEVLQDPNKDVPGVRVHWVDTCAMADEACAPTCDLDGPELEAKSKDYALGLCRQFDFSIDREKLRSSNLTREEIVARGFAKGIMTLDNFWGRTAILKLKSFAGYNAAPAPGTWDNANSTTQIPNAAYNHTLAAYMIQMGIMNKMENNYKISNGELFIDWMNSGFESGNLDGKGRKAMMDSLNLNFDLYNFAAAGVTEDLFMVENNAVAMVPYNRYGETPIEIGSKVGDILWSVPSRILPGFRYDVTHQVRCEVSGGKKRYYDEFLLETHGDIFNNPASCPITIDVSGTPTTVYNTGVISLTKQAA